MKILVINYRPSNLWNFSGCEKRLAAIMQKLEKFDIKFYLIESGPPLKKFFNLNYESSQITNLPNLITSVLWWFLSASAELFRLKLKNKTFSIIYSSTNNLPNVLIGILASKFFKKPLVIVFHHPRWPLPCCNENVNLSMRHLFKFFREEGLGIIDSLTRSLLARIELIPFKLNLVKHVIFINSWIAKHMRKLGYRGRLYISLNGCCQRLMPTTNEKTIDAIYIGRIDEGKGLVRLLLAWKLVTKYIPTAILVIVGTGSLYGKLKALIQDLGLHCNVRLLGFVSENHKRMLLSKSKLFITLSRMEGWCLAIDEALNAGLIVVSYAIPTLSLRFKQLRNDNSIKLITVDKLSEIAKVIIECLLKYPSIKNISIPSLSVLRGSWEDVARREYEIFLKILKS